MPQSLTVTYEASEQRVAAKSTALTFVIGMEDDEDVFDRHHERQGPDDDGQDFDDIGSGRRVRKSGREYVERTDCRQKRQRTASYHLNGRFQPDRIDLVPTSP